MPPRITKREYRGLACHRCHRQKVKCDREKPCRNCALSNCQCTYAIRDRKVTVTESYLKQLEGGLLAAETSGRSSRRISSDAGDSSGKQPIQDSDANFGRRSFEPLGENSTAEHFVSKLKQIRDLKTSPCGQGTRLDSLSIIQTDESEPRVSHPARYEYAALKFDTTHSICTFKLPPYPYVVHLLEQFSIYFGHDWHLFRPQTFRQKLHNTYMTVDSPESKDRAWLCKLLVVLALAESVDVGRQPEITLDLYDTISRPLSQNMPSQYIPIPGQEFFEQALMILKISYENTTVDHIEILNLIALYSNQLNRQKAAYNYAGASARLCNTLQLHKVSASIGCSPAEREHRKRLWWSTYCLDRMTSTFTGLPPALEVDQTDLAYPKEAEDPSDDVEEFSDADFLTARVQLTIIQARNLKSVSHIGLDDAEDIKTVLRPNLQRLESWRESLPAHMVSETGNNTNEPAKSLPSKRSLANMHLRFNHCIILLLRPLLLRQVACIFSNEKSNAAQEDLEYINNNCLMSARLNVLIMINVRSAGLITMSVNARRPGSFKETPDDIKTYQAGKNVLSYMMTCGSLAAKGHLNMLKEVEDLGIAIATESGGVDTDEGNQWDIEEWVTQLFESEDMLGSYGLNNSA